MTVGSNPLLTILNLGSDIFTFTKYINITNLSNCQSIYVEGVRDQEKASFQHAHSFIINDLPKLNSFTIGNKVCQDCSHFELDSPFIQSITVNNGCFQGKPSWNDPSQSGDYTLSLINRSELNTLSIGKSSFSYFSKFEISNCPKLSSVLIDYPSPPTYPPLSPILPSIAPISRRLQSIEEELSNDPDYSLPSFGRVLAVNYHNLSSLSNLYFGLDGFQNATLFSFITLPSMNNLTFDTNLFPNAASLEVIDTSISTLSIGRGCFNGGNHIPSSSDLNFDVPSSGRRLQLNLDTMLYISNNPQLHAINIPTNTFTRTEEFFVSNMDSCENITIAGAYSLEEAPFHKATYFIANDLHSLKNINLGSWVCRECSVFSALSPKIEHIEVGNYCFQGAQSMSVNDVPALQFSLTNMQSLITTDLGKGSFTYFNVFVISGISILLL